MIEIEFRGEVIARSEVETGRMSFALFCPHCGELWGKVRRGKPWYCIERVCDQHHAPWYDVGGSFFQSYEWWPGVEFGSAEPGLRKFLAANPGLLKHEVRVHMRHWAKVYQPTAEAVKQGESDELSGVCGFEGEEDGVAFG